MNSNIKIIAGKYKGSLIPLKRDSKTRPTMQRVKESVFNILEHRFMKISGLTVLDLFCCSGSYGIESLSRGASFVTFIDSDSKCMHNIEEFCKSVEAIESIKCVVSTIPPVPNINNMKYDIVFLDPPYKESNLINKAIDSLSYLEDALIVIEHHPSVSIERDKVFRKDITKSTSVSMFYIK